MTLKELPGFYTTEISTSDTGCDSVILSHILYICKALIWLCFGTQKKISFIYDLSIHSQVFSVGEERG